MLRDLLKCDLLKCELLRRELVRCELVGRELLGLRPGVRRRMLTLLATLVSLAAIAGCWSQHEVMRDDGRSTLAVDSTSAAAVSVSRMTGVEAGPPGAAPTFSWIDDDSTVHSLRDYRGRVVLVNFWATWCGPCKYELPDLVKIDSEFSDDQLVILGVNISERPPQGVSVVDQVAKFARNMKLTYRLIIGTQDVAEAYGGIKAIPTTFIIDRNGRIATRLVGRKDTTAFRKAIRAAMR